jgi:hypothetical protein
VYASSLTPLRPSADGLVFSVTGDIATSWSRWRWRTLLQSGLLLRTYM